MRAPSSRILAVAVTAATMLGVGVGAASAASAGVTGPAFYVDGALYRTVLTPADLADTAAPEGSFDTIYDFGGAQPNVATAAPTDPDYNGGRWMVHELAFPQGYAAALTSGDANHDGVLDSDAELELAFIAGTALDRGVVASFECPVIPLSGHQR